MFGIKSNLHVGSIVLRFPIAKKTKLHMALLNTF